MRCRGITVAALGLLLALANAGAAHAGMRQYAARTWASMAAMVDTPSGLPADILNRDGSTSVQTSPTDIGAYMWSAVAAERLGLISRRELRRRMAATLRSLGRMERYAGQFYNWYDHRDGTKLTDWPPQHDPNFHPILSSVDNAWLAVGLKIVRDSVPSLAARAGALYRALDFGFYYRPDVNRVLFHYRPDDPAASPCCYDTVVSESRIVDYVGIARGQLPRKEYYGRWRTFPATCDGSFQEMRPVGSYRTYFGVNVFEGAYRYAGMRLVPSWGGSMFEELMPALFVSEELIAPASWGLNHPLTVRAQIHHGLVDAGYGVWGFSPSNTPEGGYAAYGVDAVGMDPNGNPSDEAHTLVDHGWDDQACPRAAQPDPAPTAYRGGVVTPHAVFLALRYAPRAARADLRRLRSRFPGLYDRWGFHDSVNVTTGRVSASYLSLDQGMIMAALGNALGHDALRRAFTDPATARVLRAVVGVERFSDAG
jgi:Putative glucoamylase/Protein of unknown function (DUF3131)